MVWNILALIQAYGVFHICNSSLKQNLIYWKKELVKDSKNVIKDI